MIYIAKVGVYDTVAMAAATLFFTSVEGFAFRPSDTPPHAKVHGLIAQPALLRRDIADEGWLTGQTREGHGDLVLLNGDGSLDAFHQYAVDGRPVEIYFAEDKTAAFPAGYRLLFNGTSEQAVYNDSEIRLLLLAEDALASTPLQSETYAGDNAGSEGLEGISELAGKVKPLGYGRVLNAPIAFVNPAKLIYQASASEVRGISAAYVGGAHLGYDPAGPYADATELEANIGQPLRGYTRELKDGGYLRLGMPAGEAFTVDFWEGQWPSDRTAAQIWRRIAIERGGIDPAMISDADVSTLDAKNNALIGLYFAEPTSVAAAMDMAARSVGAWWAKDTQGVLRIKRLEAPAGTPVATFTDRQITGFERARFGDDTAGLPVWKVTVLGQPLELVQTSGLVGRVKTGRRARLAQEYLSAVASDASVKVAHLKAREITVTTRLICPIAMQTEAERLLSLFAPRRHRYEIGVDAPFSVLSDVDLGSVIALQRARYGMSTTLGVVVGIGHDPARGKSRLTVWGD